jgi:LAO/AO transport system kinase
MRTLKSHKQDIAKLIKGFKAGNTFCLSRLITLFEDAELHLEDIRVSLPAPKPGAVRVGITGSGGVGKSSLIDCLIAAARSKGLKVGVVAIDPSSAFSGGAVLGDRIRMQRHTQDEGVFIRSIATRGNLGGVTKSTNEIVDLMAAFGMDFIIIETTGVGQTEISIVDSADVTVLVMVPGYGDDIQLMKSGQLEFADIIVVNKADRDGAEELANSVEETFHLMTKRRCPQVILAQANNNIGIQELFEEIEKLNTNKDCGKSE